MRSAFTHFLSSKPNSYMKKHLFSLLAGSMLAVSPLRAQTNVLASTTNPPALVSTSPARNVINAAPNTNIGLTFSQAMDAATASGAAVRVYGSQTGLRSGNFSGGGSSTVTFNPSKDFKPGEKVSVSVTGNARSAAGELALAQVFDFTATTASANAGFAITSSIPLNNQAGSVPSSVTVADFDGDGDVDFAAVDYNTHMVSIRYNNGSGVFTGTYAVNVGLNPRGIVAADLDGDGDADLAVANQESETVSILENNGQGQFSLRGTFSVGSLPVTVTAADFDGDGDLDLATSNSGSASLSVLFNNGSANFNQVSSVAVEFTPGSIQAADLDNDGDVDLCNTNYFANSVTVRWNDGKGHFEGTTSFATGVNPGAVYPADLDGDGDLDLVVSNVASADVKVLKNNGNGTFATPLTLAIPQGGLQTGDFDGDGDVDLASFNVDSRVLAIRLNDGNGSFSGSNSLLLGQEPRAMNTADFDGDGKTDLVVIDESSTRAVVLLNGSNTEQPLCQANGLILREYWAKVKGNQTSQVPVNKAPTSTSYLTSFEAPSNVGENYASRIRGYLCAPETGNYTFWIASDDYGDLYLSSDEDPANKQLIAYIKGFSNPRQWNKHSSQKSALIYLEKGKRYYIEALHKEAWVNDNLAVAWRLPSAASSSSPVVIPGSVLSPFQLSNTRQELAEVSSAEEEEGLQLQAAPNPFSRTTTVTFKAQETGKAVLALYDLQGQRVQSVFEGEVQAGEHQQAIINGSRLSQGLYLLRLVNGSQVQQFKLVLSK
jgi:hypothetical protein